MPDARFPASLANAPYQITKYVPYFDDHGEYAGNGKAGTTNGGSYSNCSDHSAPGVKGVFDYLNTLSYATFHDGDCAPGHYYLLNNYNPGYNVDGSLNTSTFTVPPQHSTPTIGDELSAHGISLGRGFPAHARWA